MTTAQMTMAAGMMPGLKAKLQTAWTAGNYDHFSRFMEGEARRFYERLNVLPGMRLLDVACGSGQVALMAARDGVRSTGVDIAGNLIERAKARAAGAKTPARFEVADAEALPFADATFDVVVSLYGAMFAPRPEMVAEEMARVCVPGGKIAMANWTASGFVGQMFKVISGYIAPTGMPSPLLWGDEETVRARLETLVSDLKMARRTHVFDYPFPPSEVVEFFRRCYGPAHMAFRGLDETGQLMLQQELEDLWSSHNRGSGMVTVVESEYLEVTAIRDGGAHSRLR